MSPSRTKHGVYGYIYICMLAKADQTAQFLALKYHRSGLTKATKKIIFFFKIRNTFFNI